MKKELLTIFSLVLCLNLITIANENKEKLKIPFEKYILGNGLNVILHTDHSDPIASVYVCYHVGSNREVKGKTGFAHLFEHIMFQESQNVSQDQYFKKIQDAGGKLNGGTSFDKTIYYETFPKNALEMVLWLESDRMGFLLSKLSQESFENQQNVVKNEKRQRVDNVPYGNTSYVLNKLLYPEDHPYNWQVIGSMEDLNNATLQDVIDFYNKFYGPQNATLVIAGDFDAAQTKEWIEKYFGEIKGGKKSETLPKIPVILTETKKGYYEDNFARSPLFVMAFPTVEQYDKDSYALQYFANLFSGSKKSPLYQVIVKEKKLAPSVSSNQSSLEIAGSFIVGVQTYPNKNLTEVEAAVQEAFARFEKEGFTDKDLQRLKNGIEVGFYNEISSVENKASKLGDLNEFAHSPDFLGTDLNSYLSVTKEDIWRVYNKYIKGKSCVELSTVPKGKAELAAEGSQLYVVQKEATQNIDVAKKEKKEIKVEPILSKFDRTKEPPKEPYPVVKQSEIWTGKTKNGIKIFGITQKEVPLIQFSIIIKGGMLLDTKDKVGTAFLTANLMNQGTKTKTPIELREALQDLGAMISVNSGSESFLISGTCLKDKLDETITLAKEIMFEPRWDENEFELVKLQAIESLRREETNPSSVAKKVFRKLIYGSDNILSLSAMGTMRSIESITIGDLKDYYNKYFSSTTASISIVGDIVNEEASNVFNLLSDWQAKEIEFPEIKVEPFLTKSGVYFVDVPNAWQSELMDGHYSLSRIDPDYYKAVIMNYKLGGNFNSILNMILREEKGYTYNANSNFSGTAYPGMFAISTSVQTNATFESTQIIHDQINKYREGISKEDLEIIKATIANGDALNYETLSQLSTMMAPIIMYNLPFDYIKKQQDVVKQMTVEEHKMLSQKYLLPDKMIYLIVGDKATQFDKLKYLGIGDPILLDKDGEPISK